MKKLRCGLCSLWAILPFACGPAGPPLTDGPYVESDPGGELTVVWSTAEPAASLVTYGLTSSLGAEARVEGDRKDHRVTLTGLRRGRSYHFQVAAQHEAATFVSDAYFSRGPYVQNVRPEGASLFWRTNSRSPVTIQVLGPIGNMVVKASGGHSRLQALNPGEYRYRVIVDGVSSTEGRFRKPNLNATDIRIVLYGDSRGNPSVVKKLSTLMAARQADLILHSGDFVGNGRNEEEWDPQFFNPTAALLRTAALYPAIGNHEADDRSYYDAFEVPGNGSAERPEAWYAFDYGPVHLTVLDTNPESGLFEPGTEQLSWLQQDLTSAKARWKLVMFHHPLYSSGRHKSNLDLRKKLMHLFEEHDVDLLISGHDHCYERTWPLEGDKRAEGGIVHFVSGGGGATLYPVGRDTWTAVSASTHHYCILDVKGDRLDLDVFDLNDHEVDAFTLVKESEAKRLADALDSATDLTSHIRLLGRTADRRNVEGIRAHAGSADLTIRRAVAEALSRIGSSETIRALAALSGDDDTEVRRWATRGLAYVDGRASSTYLIDRLSDADPETRRFAAIGLRLTPVRAALDSLLCAAEDTEAAVRLAVVEALAFYGTDPARKAIVDRLADESVEVRRMAVSVVEDSKLEKLAAPALVLLLPKETEVEKIRILQLLGKAGDPASVDAMQVQLSEGTISVRRRAAIELGQLLSDRAVSGLIEALDDKDRGVRQFAWRALRVITGKPYLNDQTAWRNWHKGR